MVNHGGVARLTFGQPYTGTQDLRTSSFICNFVEISRRLALCLKLRFNLQTSFIS